MGRVSDEVVRLIRRQVDEHGIVLWYDHDRVYEALAQDLKLDGTAVFYFEDSYFALRRAVDEYLEEERPRLVVYLQKKREEARERLIELACAGVEVYPGAASRPCNSRLSLVAKPLFAEQAWKSIEKSVESGVIGLADLDRLAERPAGMLSLIFGGAPPEAIALQFVASSLEDAEIVAKGAAGELAELLQQQFGLAVAGDAQIAALRDAFARHAMLSELKSLASGDLPGALASVPVAAEGQARDACVRLCATWRSQHDLAEGYEAAATKVERELDVRSLPFTFEQLAAVQTFLGLDEQLQLAVERRLRTTTEPADVDLARKRLDGFWSRRRPEVASRWAMVMTAGELLLMAEQVAGELKATPKDASAILAAYTEGERPWHLLDSHQRRLETLAFSFDWGSEHEALSELRYHAVHRFSEVAGALAEAFVRAFKEAGFSLPGRKRQRDVFRAYVTPAAQTGKTAYVLVDALRFEMANELVAGLGDAYGSTLDWVLGSVPSITEVGMAALLAGLDGQVELADGGAGKVGLKIGQTLLKDRSARIKWLEEHAGLKLFTVKLEDLLANRKAVTNGIAAAELVLVTSQEIDLLCEQGNIALARNTMDTVIRDLRRGFGVLARNGVETVVVTADHGYLFGEEAGTDMTIDPPGGETVDLHRRVWVGRGGAANPACLRFKASDVGWSGDLEVVTPWNAACFKAGGSRAYFHGGLSPQEIVVPVAVLKVRQAAQVTRDGGFQFELATGAREITTRIVTVHLQGRAKQKQIFGGTPPRVRVEVRVGSVIVSAPYHADYGWDERNGEIDLQMEDDGFAIRPNTVVLQLQETISQASEASIHLLDAINGMELRRTSIPVRIAL
jgi:hypothetical protein